MEIGLANTGIQYQTQLTSIHHRQSQLDISRTEDTIEARRQAADQSMRETTQAADTVAKIKEVGYEQAHGRLIDTWA